VRADVLVGVAAAAGGTGSAVSLALSVGQATPRSGSGASGALGSRPAGSLPVGCAGGGGAGAGAVWASASPETDASPAAAHSSRAAPARETRPLIKRKDLASAPE